MDRERLLNGLQSFSSESDSAATVLADPGDRAALPATLGSIVRDSSWGTIPEQTVAALIRPADVGGSRSPGHNSNGSMRPRWRITRGDIGDDFWRLQSAVHRMLVRMGQQVAEPVPGQGQPVEPAGWGGFDCHRPRPAQSDDEEPL
ncbi:MAG: hypothetical protein JWO38_3797 [Gemmataceae bacterium]|nr:hypothetical protein [Gemmataceae bacterium]